MRRTALIILLLSGVLVTQAAACQLKVRIEPRQQSMIAGVHHQMMQAQLAHHLLAALAARVQCQLIEQALPSARAIQFLESGDIHIMVGMSKNAERALYSVFIGPHHYERMVVVGEAGPQIPVKDLTVLLQQTGMISVTQGSYYGPLWQQFVPFLEQQGRLFYATANQQKVAMLVSGRVMATIEDEATIDEMFNSKLLSSKLFSKWFVLHENPVYFAVSNAVPAMLRQQLGLAWQQMEQSGEVAQITRQFNQDFLYLR